MSSLRRSAIQYRIDTRACPPRPSSGGAAFRTDLQRKLTELKKEGKLKEAEEFANEANELLKPYKTRPLSVHFTLPIRKQE